jgi:hypothetical protein
MLERLPIELLLLVAEELEFNDFWSLCNSTPRLSRIFTFNDFIRLLKIFSARGGKHCDDSIQKLRSLPQHRRLLCLSDSIANLHSLACVHLLLCLFRESGVDHRVQFLLHHGTSPRCNRQISEKLIRENPSPPSPRLELLLDYGPSPHHVSPDVTALYGQIAGIYKVTGRVRLLLKYGAWSRHIPCHAEVHESESIPNGQETLLYLL